MRSKEEIKELVQQNIDLIKVSEFVAEGGWPNLDAIDVLIFKQQEDKGIETVVLDILYDVTKAGCCFIPGGENQMRLRKEITIENNQLNIV